MEPNLIFLIPVTSDPYNLQLKINDSKKFIRDCNLYNSEVWVVCNNSCSKTIEIASELSDNYYVFGKIGKFMAIKNVINDLPCDSFTVLTDVNTQISSFDRDHLFSFLQPNSAIIYSTVIRKDPSKPIDVAKPHLSYRLYIDNFLNYSSGAYGALYIINSNLLINNFNKLIPTQNDDFFIPCVISEYGDVHYCDSLIILEEESLSFNDEFSRKFRDSQGHIKCLINLLYVSFIYKSKSCLYGVIFRGFIWISLFCAPLFLIYSIFIFPWLLLFIAPFIYFKKILFYRLLGFYFGFFRGLFGQRLSW